MMTIGNSLCSRRFSLGLAVLLSSPLAAWAQAEACYVAKDADGVFAGKRLLPVVLADADAAPGQPQLTNAQFAGVKRCYAKANQRMAGFQGGMELGLRTDGAGRVNRVSVLQMEHNDNAFSACVANLACTWQVGNVAGGAEAHLSFALGMKETVDRPDFLDPRKVNDSQAYK